jgi:thiamine transporter ThiT
MRKNTKTTASTKQMVLLALFTALVAILAYFGRFVKLGGLASSSLTLIPVVLGAALCGPWAGA